MLDRLPTAIARRFKLGQSALGRRERRIMLAIAKTVIPGGATVPEPNDASIDRLEAQLDRLGTTVRGGLRALLWALEIGAVGWRGRRFSRLKPKQRLVFLQALHDGDPARRLALRALISPLKVAHFDDEAIFEQIGCTYSWDAPAELERQRWMQNLIPVPELDEDLELEADVVVVGTGAGGAVVAKELAEKGLAVAMVEEGRYFGRPDFDGRCMPAMAAMYRGRGTMFTVGTTPILIPAGKTVGGTTTVNSGTCLRLPDRVLRSWQVEFGLTELTPDSMAPHFDKVEALLQVETAKTEHLSGCARVIKRGCEALGYTEHGPLRRNAPDCDGQGVCCFGCPTDAKRSTNVSYVPLALKHQASLFSQARVTKILVENGRAVGVLAKGRVADNGARTTRELVVRAKAVVIACGTFFTPPLLMQNKLANTSGQLGRNLTIHPAAAMMAEFDEEIRGWDGIPQGYGVHQFRNERLTFEGGFTPPDVFAPTFSLIGPQFTEVMEAFNRVAVFGYMVEDSSRGRVRLGPMNRPVVSYNLNKADLRAMKRGSELLAEIFFAGGAKRVFSCVHGHDVISNFRDLQRLRDANIRAIDLTLSAFHPLGTARIGVDPSKSVCGPDHQTHDVPGLYVVDGSNVPSALGVNPQLTIMALATRAAEMLAERLG